LVVTVRRDDQLLVVLSEISSQAKHLGITD